MPGAAAILTGAGALGVISLLLKATLVLGMAWILAAAARGSSAAVRHGIWVAALVGIVTLPVASLWLPPLDIQLPDALTAAPVRSPQGGSGSARLPMNGVDDIPVPPASPGATPGFTASLATDAASSPSASRPDWVRVLLALWLIGVCTRVLWFAAQLARVRRLTRSATAVVDHRLAAAAEITTLLGIRRSVLLLECRRIATPLTCGLRRPIILIPENSHDWPCARLRVVLLHELAHIRRWDYVTCLVAEAACALYWPIPLVWIARRSVHAEQEQASDDLVLASGTTAVDYAEHLLAIARALRGESRLLSATIGMAREIGLKRRIRMILDGSTRRVPLRSPHGAATLIALTAFALPVAAVRPAQPSRAVSDAGALSPVVSQDTASLASSEATAAPAREVYLWLEAEHGLLRGALELREDLDASSGHYIVAMDDENGGETVLSLHLPNSGEYLFWGRVSGDGTNDHFRVSIDDQPVTRWDFAGPDGTGDGDWSWVRGGESGDGRTPLARGVHTLRIANPPGRRLDRVLVTTDSTYVPEQRGQHPKGFEPDYHWAELSPGTMNAETDFEFEVSEAGSYVVWGRVLGRDGESNSLFLSVDGRPEVIWDAPRRDLGREQGRWTWDPASARDVGGRTVDPLILDLAPGRHTIRLRPREAGTGLGGLLVTNDLSYRPRGTPPGTPSVRVWLEPETGSRAKALQLRRGAGAVGQGYLEAAERGREPGRPGDGSAALRFDLPIPGVYTLWARTVAKNDGEDSFWLRLNDGEWVRWNGIPRSREWRWSAVHDADARGEPVEFVLPAGENRIEIARREGGARVDRFLLTNEDQFEPRGTGAE